MNNIKLGELITNPRQRRDAVHVACIPARATYRLRPGQWLAPDGRPFGASASEGGCGIVDPFLPTLVLPGQVFWLLLPPGSITGLRHHYSHPSFPDGDEPQLDEPLCGNPELTAKWECEGAEAEKWLRDFACRWGMDYNLMLLEADAGGILTADGRDLNRASELNEDRPGQEDDFW
jgi:hypothetical protein